MNLTNRPSLCYASAMDNAEATMLQAIEIAEQRWANDDRRVMIAKDRVRERELRHVRLFRDEVGLYVRLGKRGTNRRYLRDLPSARIVSRDLVVFHEYE